MAPRWLSLHSQCSVTLSRYRRINSTRYDPASLVPGNSFVPFRLLGSRHWRASGRIICIDRQSRGCDGWCGFAEYRCLARGKINMKKAILLIPALFASALLPPVTMAATPADVTAPIYQFIDGFNAGDVKSAYAAYATGDVTIVDEFAPHLWTGPHAPQAWAAAYGKHAQATGVTDGLVKYGTPTRTQIEGSVAYVIVPTVYLYKEHGNPFAEEGQMTFVLVAERGRWKIRSWTWSGVKPHPAK